MDALITPPVNAYPRSPVAMSKSVVSKGNAHQHFCRQDTLAVDSLDMTAELHAMLRQRYIITIATGGIEEVEMMHI